MKINFDSVNIVIYNDAIKFVNNNKETMFSYDEVDIIFIHTLSDILNLNINITKTRTFKNVFFHVNSKHQIAFTSFIINPKENIENQQNPTNLLYLSRSREECNEIKSSVYLKKLSQNSSKIISTYDSLIRSQSLSNVTLCINYQFLLEIKEAPISHINSKNNNSEHSNQSYLPVLFSKKRNEFRLTARAFRKVTFSVCHYENSDICCPLKYESLVSAKLGWSDAYSSMVDLNNPKFEAGADNGKSFRVTGYWPINQSMLSQYELGLDKGLVTFISFQISVKCNILAAPIVIQHDYQLRIFNSYKKPTLTSLEHTMHSEDLCLSISNDSLDLLQSNYRLTGVDFKRNDRFGYHIMRAKIPIMATIDSISSASNQKSLFSNNSTRVSTTVDPGKRKGSKIVGQVHRISSIDYGSFDMGGGGGGSTFMSKETYSVDTPRESVKNSVTTAPNFFQAEHNRPRRPSVISNSINVNNNNMNNSVNLTNIINTSNNKHSNTIDLDQLDSMGKISDEFDEENIYSGMNEYALDDETDPNLSMSNCEMWQKLICEWRKRPDNPPKTMLATVKVATIPHIFRKDVWLIKTNALSKENYEKFEALYPKYLETETEYDKVIQWDSKRTFPRHDFFKDEHSKGQTALYNICKAYANHDTEVGYCQGMSFIAAIFLLHLPEFEAFLLLVQLFETYQHREVYLDNFLLLKRDLYMLGRLVSHFLPKLQNHLEEIGVDIQMFAPQWFLSMYTSKFPLSVVYTIFDMIFLFGRDYMIRTALAILQLSERELLRCTFDQALDYFRKKIPRLYLSRLNILALVQVTTTLNIPDDYFTELEVDFARYKSLILDDSYEPNETLKKENQMLFDRLIRAENDNDTLVQEIAALQVERYNETSIEAEREKYQKDTICELRNNIARLARQVQDLNKINEELQNEINLILDKTKEDAKKKDKTIEEYRIVCKNLKEELNKNINEHRPSIIKSIYEHTNEFDRDSPDFSDRHRLESELARVKLLLADSECANDMLKKKIQESQNKDKDKDGGLLKAFYRKMQDNMHNKR